jgi:hypothetical protein
VSTDLFLQPDLGHRRASPWKSTATVEMVSVPVAAEHFKPGSTVTLTGEALRDIGIERAGSGQPVVVEALWREKARAAIVSLAKKSYFFTAEDVRKEAGDPPTPNSMGAALRSAYQAGIIIPASVTIAARPSRHSSLMRSWRRA